MVANDSDPEGNYPLVLVSKSYSGLRGTASLVGTTSIQFVASNATGTAVIGYTVKDSLGATSTGTFSVTLTAGGTCP